MTKEISKDAELNLYQKLLKIADAAGILQKTKEGFGYKYVPEHEIQAKVTANMQKLGVMLHQEITPNTLEVTPYSYEKYDKKLGKIVPINEIIIKADTIYTWTNAENPEEFIKVPWVIVGQMDDASQAFGAAETYCNRYFLLKTLQLATSDDDPDNYRSKQKEAEMYEEDKVTKEIQEALDKAKQEIKNLGSELIKKGLSKDEIMNIVGKYNNGNTNPSTISNIETCEKILKEFKEIPKKSTKKVNKEGEIK